MFADEDATATAQEGDALILRFIMDREQQRLKEAAKANERRLRDNAKALEAYYRKKKAKAEREEEVEYVFDEEMAEEVVAF
jgi:hypothetical protein